MQADALNLCEISFGVGNKFFDRRLIYSRVAAIDGDGLFLSVIGL